MRYKEEHKQTEEESTLQSQQEYGEWIEDLDEVEQEKWFLDEYTD